MTVYNSAGDSDGTSFGQSGEKIGFFGTTPVVQPTAAVAVSTSAAVSGAFGFTSAQAAAIITAINTLIANNASLGLDA